MNVRPLPVRGWFDNRGSARLGIALVAASALHAAAIFGIDVKWNAPAVTGSAADLVLQLESALPLPIEPAGSAAADAGAARAARTDPQQSAAPASVDASEQRPGRVDAQSPATGAAPSTSPHRARSTLPSVPDGLPHDTLAKAVASAHALRERQPDAALAATRTRRLTSASTRSTVETAYLEMWRQKVQRIGRANYPPGGLSGELVLLAVIRHDGTLEECRILDSSGIAVLDQAALRIVRLAAPFSHFPVEMRKSYDRLELVRGWKFARNGAFH